MDGRPVYVHVTPETGTAVASGTVNVAADDMAFTNKTIFLLHHREMFLTKQSTSCTERTLATFECPCIALRGPLHHLLFHPVLLLVLDRRRWVDVTHLCDVTRFLEALRMRLEFIHRCSKFRVIIRRIHCDVHDTSMFCDA